MNKPVIKFPDLFDESSSFFTDSEFTNDSLSLRDTEVDSLSEVLVNCDSLRLTESEIELLSTIELFSDSTVESYALADTEAFVLFSILV